VRRVGILLAGLLAAAGALAQGDDDGLRRLENDPSPKAGRTLSRLYHSTVDRDQRFWLVQALGKRLREHSEVESLDALLLAAQEADPGLRAPALRALTNFDHLPREALARERLKKIESVAQLGAGDSAGPVRDAARELERALRLFKDPSSRKTPPPPEEISGPSPGFWARAAGLLKWAWIVLFPFVGGLWVWAGTPVFDGDGEEGRFASAAFRPLADQYAFLALCGFLWVSLASLVGGYGFYAMALTLGEPLYRAPGGWPGFYCAAGLCMVLPGSMAAAGFARRPSGSVVMSSLRAFPISVILCSTALLFFAPLEAFYRLFMRLPRGERDPHSDALGVLLGVLDTGSFRTAHLAAAIASREGRGLLPALRRALYLVPENGLRRRAGLGSIDPRFSMLCAAPAMAFLCSLVAKGMPVRWQVGWPILLLACAVWAWGVLAAVLYALLQTLSGVDAAAQVVRAQGGGLSEAYQELQTLYDKESDDA